MRLIKHCLAASLLTAVSSGPAVANFDAEGEVTFIHMGDLHGHLIPHPNMRSDGNGQAEGGLARIFTLVEKIRAAHPDQTLLVNTGDTLHGGAEVLFTKGQAMIDVLNAFGIDAYVPGNWDYMYGADKFFEYFAGDNPRANWNALIANLYFDGYPGAESKTGEHVAPPYLVKKVGGLRVGIIGLTSERGPSAGDKSVTNGLKFTDGQDELREYAHRLRAEENADLVVVLSELGLHNNLSLANRIPGIDVILSSDKHEITTDPIVSQYGTLIVEQGMDGQVIGELTIEMKRGKVVRTRYVSHRITDQFKEHDKITALVNKARRPFVDGPDFQPGAVKNPVNGAPLRYPIDKVIGHTDVSLYRSNFSDEKLPGVIEGSSHDFLTDAFRSMTDAQLGGIKGFRYGTTIAPGPIKLEDLYHYMPIGAQIAKGKQTGAQIKKMLEGKSQGEKGRDQEWTHGWTAGFSGLTADFDPLAPAGERVRNLQIDGKAIEPDKHYTVAGFYFDALPDKVNQAFADEIEVLKADDGSVLDATDVVARYLETLPDKRVTADGLTLGRIRLINPLPKAEHGFQEIQPLGKHMAPRDAE